MGDRGNIKVIEGEVNAPIFFYTHWRGSDLPEIVAKALQRGQSRWDDAPYLNRIIFQMLLDGDNDVTGFGIAPYECDSGPLVEVFHGINHVRYEGIESTFEKFVELYA